MPKMSYTPGSDDVLKDIRKLLVEINAQDNGEEIERLLKEIVKATEEAIEV